MSLSGRFSWFFVPSLVQGGIAFAMVPVVTYVLGPEDLGLFALVSILPSILSVMGPMGASYLLAQYYPLLDAQARREMISSMLIGGAVVLISTTGLFVLCWYMWVHRIEVFSAVPSWALGISFVTMLLGFPWTIANDVLTLEARAESYAAVTTAQGLASAGTTVTGLFVFDWGVKSLFVAAAVGAFVTCIGAFSTLRPYCRFQVTRHWINKMVHVGVPATSATFVETLQSFAERYTLSAFAGIGDLGLLAHSQQYRALIAMVLKAVARSLWPVTLAEAKETPVTFAGTRTGWTLSYLFVTAAGLIFATVGQDIIALLTHGKFTEAYWMVCLWAIFILVQNAGKSDTGILFARGETVAYSKMMTLANLLGISLMLALVPLLGTFGVFAALITQQIVFRVGVYLKTRRLHAPIQREDWVWAGMLTIGTILVVVRWANLGLPGRMLTCAILLVVLLCVARRHVSIVCQQVKMTFNQSLSLSMQRIIRPLI